MPPNVSILLTKRTSRGGRKGRGRTFLPAGWVPETNVDQAGNIEPGWVTDIQSQWESFRVDCIGANVALSLLHADGSPGDPLISFTCQPLVATQRRRLR